MSSSEHDIVRIEDADLVVEYGAEYGDNAFADSIAKIDAELEIEEGKLVNLNAEINKLTNHADSLDYTIAVCSGVLTGLIDSFFVGEFSLTEGKAWGSEKANNFVKWFAKKNGYNGDSLDGAIRNLENKFGLTSDGLTPEFGGSRQHHLRDFAHHPTPVGWAFSMLTQFTGNAYGTNTLGAPMVVPIENSTFIGKTLSEKFVFGTINWFGHMVSDVAGSSNTPGAGMGLPGPLGSLLKELSALLNPLFKNDAGQNTFSLLVSKLYNGTLARDENGKLIPGMGFDLRAELGVLQQLGKQALPVLLNEIIVRLFYFARRLKIAIETYPTPIKHFSDLKSLDWKEIIPHKNRTIRRMLTIATGTFTAVDLADAAIRSGGFNPAMLLKVNFVGVGRFCLAIHADVSMAIQKSRRERERIVVMARTAHLKDAKLCYKEADMWVEAKTAGELVDKTSVIADKSIEFLKDSVDEDWQNMEDMNNIRENIETKNPGLLDSISEIM